MITFRFVNTFHLNRQIHLLLAMAIFHRWITSSKLVLFSFVLRNPKSHTNVTRKKGFLTDGLDVKEYWTGMVWTKSGCDDSMQSPLLKAPMATNFYFPILALLAAVQM